MDNFKYETCPVCENTQCRGLYKWQDQNDQPKLSCLGCKTKGQKIRAAAIEAQRKAFKEEAEVAMASERDTKKAAALQPRDGRQELGHWVDKIEVKDGRDTITQDFMVRITSINAATVKPEPPRWLWDQRIPAGQITYGVGKPGNAKSLWATDLAARVSSGQDFPDGAKNPNPNGKKVLMYAGEDDIKRTVIPRLMAAGANLANIELLDNQSFEVYDKEFTRIDRREIDLSQDCKMLNELVKAHDDITLLIIDPITGVFGNKNVNHDKDMRPVMNELKDMLEKRNLTLVGISHTNKRSDAAAIDQIQGASSIAGAARAAWLFTHDPESDDEHAHLMSCIKVNTAEHHTGLRMLTKAVEVDGVGKHPVIIWGEGTKAQADEVNQAIKEKRETKGGKRDGAKQAILAMLLDGAKLSWDVYAALEKLGHSNETLKRAAGELTDAKEIYRKQRDKRWYMVLPEHLHEFDQQTEASKPEPEVLMAVSADEGL